MSQEEESSGRVTRGALRRRSIDQDTSIGPGTPKKATAASAKKGPALDAILETNGTEPTPRGVNKAVQKLKELEPEKAIRRSRAASLTEENVEAAQLGGSGEVRRTPRRRASQDHSVAEPQTAPAATRRMTRRNSVTSDDGSVTAVSTPKASTKSRLNVSVAPPTIVEDDEKDTSNAEANLSDLDIRKLRNRSISNSPVPRGSPTGKNGSMREEESNTSVASTKGVSIMLQDIVKSPKPATPVASPTKAATELAAETSVVEMEPLVVTGSNAKLNETSPEVFDIDETVQESPKEVTEPKPTEPAAGTPQKTADQSSVEIADKSSAELDRSLANIVEDVRENMATAADMSILGTPAKPPKGGLLSRLREGSCSTPIADEKKKPLGSPKFVSNTPDGRGQKDGGSGDAGEKLSKSWSQAVKGSAGKGIDVFSVRKQEEQERKEEETKRLNESLKESAKKRKSLKKAPSEDEDDEEVDVSELLGGESSQDGSNFIDDEAMEVDGYESGDSINSEDRREMEDNEVPEHGETIGSEDSDSDEDEEGDDDSFIAPEDEDEKPELLEGTGDDLDGSDVEQDKSKTKKRKRIIQVVDTSDDEKEVSKKDLTTISLDRTATASENSTVEVVKSPKKTPVKAVEQSPKKTPAKAPEQSPKKSPAPAVKQSPAKEPLNPTEAPKSRKSMPPPLLVSADFYSPAAKKAKRATINVLANEEEEHEPVADAKKTEKPGLLANPAALALAKKNKRQSLDQASTADKKPESKRASLPGKLPADKPLDKSLKKKRVKDLSEFDADAILNRCNEIVRADKERKKQSATLRQKKKDEKRRQRELDEAEGSGEDKEGDDSGSPDKKKKKKKKKPINYMLEELGETKEEQVARALKRKLALLEAKRERKKAKKAAKLQRQLNKENQDGGESQAAGIGAKFEKKAKKKDKKSSVVEQLVTEPAVEVPKVKLAVSAFQAYKEQIEELGKEQQSKGKKKTKQLKEKNQQQQQQPPTAVEEVKAALQVEAAKPKKEKKKISEVVAEEIPPPESEQPKKKKKLEEPEAPQKPPKKSSEVMQQEALAEQKKLDEELAKLKKAISEPIPKPAKKPKSQAEQRKLDEDLAKLKQALSDPVAKVVKKQKLPNQEKPTVTCPEVESTPPRKLKALARLESGFTEEPVTPEQQKIRRNHGFREEPVTPKPVGFKVSAVLPTGQQELAQRAALTKKHNKKAANANRVRPEDVQEPVRSLPIPVWTRSGKFEVEELTAAAAAGKKKTKRAKSFDDGGGYIPVNGGGSAKSSTEFLVKPLSAKKEASAKKANRIDLATVDDEVINFKKQAIFGKTAHLREKKSKH
ncbi:hypothetical protein pipiens_011553 [Culex pipiens pipiens]|uniref:Uncharacterized protein n=1 Tax=Culex pipiens pipiens TaxID=38569 RepID=A0ABD1D5Z7_CULPP